MTTPEEVGTEMEDTISGFNHKEDRLGSRKYQDLVIRSELTRNPLRTWDRDRDSRINWYNKMHIELEGQYRITRMFNHKGKFIKDKLAKVMRGHHTGIKAREGKCMGSM